MKFIVIILIALPFLSLADKDADNLVPNGYFNELLSIPHHTNEFQFAKNWINPTQASPDLLSAQSIGRASCPGPVAGLANPVRGTNCAGIITYKKSEKFSGNGKYGFREYISTLLKRPLIKGEKYEINFKYLITEESAYYCENIEILFSEKAPMNKEFVGPLDYLKPQFKVSKLHRIEKEIWYEAKIEFIATGRERFMTIGNFHRNKDSKIHQVKSYLSPHIYSNYCYLMIDNIKVKRVMSILELEKRAKTNYITFDLNADSTDAKDSLQMLFYFCKMHSLIDSNVRLQIQAYSDISGSKEVNIKICSSRSNFIRTYLIDQGIQAKQFDGLYYPQIGEGRQSRKVKNVALTP